MYAVRRKSGKGDVLAVFNFSDWMQPDYAVKIGSDWKETLLIDSDWNSFGGDTKDAETQYTRTADSLVMNVPPFSGRMFFLTHK